MGRSALAIRAVRQSLGGLPLISVRHSGWPGHVLRQNSGRSARAIRAIRQLVSSCTKLFELTTVIIPSEAALPKIKTAVTMRAGVIRILTIRARPCWSGTYATTQHAPMSAGVVQTRSCEELSRMDHPTMRFGSAATPACHLLARFRARAAGALPRTL